MGGDAFSIADIAVATHFVVPHHTGYAVDDARWPALSGYVERMLARASFRAVLEDGAREIGDGPS